MSFSQLISQIKRDLKSHGANSLPKSIYHFFFNAKFRLLLNYRIGHCLYKKKSKVFKIALDYYKYKQITKRNCQISYSAEIGNNVAFVHPIGIVIGDNVIIKDNVRIWQQVTLGSHGKNEEKQQYPTIHENVKIFAGAKIFGDIQVGKYSIVAANAVVNKSVLEYDVVGGIPAKSLKKI